MDLLYTINLVDKDEDIKDVTMTLTIMKAVSVLLTIVKFEIELYKVSLTGSFCKKKKKTFNDYALSRQTVKFYIAVYC